MDLTDLKPHLDLDLPGRPEDNRVVVAMSGGVDSSVVAVLLHEVGYQVVGVTLQLYDHGEATHRSGACCAGQDIHDARRVAEQFGFPHYVLDYESRFREAVIEDFADSYLAGETPIPCVACNQKIKFRDLLETARELGADALATGHYVQSRSGPAGRELVRARDAHRDQSYFLFTTTQAQLDFVRFPLGGLDKPRVRDVAASYGLGVAEKSDSQDICFVPSGNYAAIIEKLRPGAAQPGDIVHLDGRVLGQHDGILHYTIGQRRGIKVAIGEPLYVVELDAATNRVIVGPKEALATAELSLPTLNWLGDHPLEAIGADGLACFVKIRSSMAPRPATLFARDGGALVSISGGEQGVSPGQACVFYADESDESRVLGGGYIAATTPMTVVTDKTEAPTEISAA